MIYAMIPFREDANLGLAYNKCMALLPDDAWAVFVDHDAMPTTGRWHAQFSEAIAFKPDAGAIVAMANRIYSPWQQCGDRQSNDYQQHREFGKQRAAVRTLLDISATKGFGGVAFAVSKQAWGEVGGFADGLGCVDHSIFFKMQRVGRKVWLHEGIYYFHWRHFGETDPTTLHPRAANCQCRGYENPPTERITLP